MFNGRSAISSDNPVYGNRVAKLYVFSGNSWQQVFRLQQVIVLTATERLIISQNNDRNNIIR